MRTKSTEALILSQRIREKIKNNDFGVIKYLTDDAKRLQLSVRREIAGEDWSRRVTLSVGDGGLYVFIKDIPYQEKLETLLRQAMVHIDDENLYDRIMKVLEEKYDYTITK